MASAKSWSVGHLQEMVEASGAEPGATLTLAEDQAQADELGGGKPRRQARTSARETRGEVPLLYRWWIREVGPDGSP